MEGFQRYVPEKELPEEIKKLPLEETKCRFCGVSYLVHHEVAKLEEEVGKLRELVTKMEKEKEALQCLLTAAKEREQQLKGEVEQGQDGFREMENDLQRLKLKEKGILERESRYFSTLKQFHMAVKYIQTSLQDIRNKLAKSTGEVYHASHTAVVQLIQDHVAAWKRERSTLRERLVVIDRARIEMGEQLAREREDSATMTTKLKVQLKEVEEKCTMLTHELQNRENRIHKLTTSAEEQNRIVHEKLSKSHERCSTLGRELDSLKMNLENKSNELQVATEKYKLSQAALEKQMLQQEREHLHCTAQLEKEKQDALSKLTLSEAKLFQLTQRLEMLTAQHQTELNKAFETQQQKNQEKMAQLKASILQDANKVLSVEQLKHEKSIEQVHKSYHMKVAQLELKIDSLKRDHSTEIEKLKTELSKEQQLFDVEVSRHIQEKKNMTLELERVALEHDQIRLISQQELEQCKNVGQAKIEEREESIRKYESQCAELSKKLKSAYIEISSLQNTVERQCLERRELLTQKN